MGHRLDPFPNRQRSHLTETKPRAASSTDSGTTAPVFRVVVLALLAVDGILSAAAGALLLPTYIGATPFPISALISGLVNAALVWAAGRWTRSPRVAALPLLTWLATVAVMSLGGPGGDVIFAGKGLMAYSAFLLLALGVLPSAWVLLRASR